MYTISYYNANGSNVYALMLDASKAFDRVKFSKLFRILLNRQMSPLVLRLLFYTRGNPCQHGFMFGYRYKQWSNDISESNRICSPSQFNSL